MSEFSFKGKTALVTGANRGIGEGFVHTLIKQGVETIYCAVRELNSLSPLIAKYPEQIKPIQLDVTKPDTIKQLSEKIKHLDILVNNAGIANACNSSSEETIDIARAEMEVNFFGPVQVTYALLPALKRSKEAAIVNICSIAAISNFPAIGPYSATKAAIHSFTQGLRYDLSIDNIKVVGVYPGPINTRMAEGWEMEKPQPEQVAIKTCEALEAGNIDVMPDDFSTQLYETFLSHPHELENALAQMQ